MPKRPRSEEDAEETWCEEDAEETWYEAARADERKPRQMLPQRAGQLSRARMAYEHIGDVVDNMNLAGLGQHSTTQLAEAYLSVDLARDTLKTELMSLLGVEDQQLLDTLCDVLVEHVQS